MAVMLLDHLNARACVDWQPEDIELAYVMGGKVRFLAEAGFWVSASQQFSVAGAPPLKASLG
jgi:ABC-type taurine transport system substrate-binding protein